MISSSISWGWLLHKTSVWSSLIGQSSGPYRAGVQICWPYSSLCFWPLLNTLQNRVNKCGRSCQGTPLPVLTSSSLSCSPSTNISAWLVFQKGKYISLVLFLYCKPSLDLQSIYLSINLPFKCSQPLWESYHSWRYFPFKAASLSSDEEIWDGKFFRIISYWKQSCSP